MKENDMNTLSKLLVFSLLVLSTSAHATSITQFLTNSIGKPGEDSNGWKPIDTSVKYFVEDDSYDKANQTSLDAEAIYVKHDATDFYIAVITSLSSESNPYKTGNLWFDIGGNGSYDYKFKYGNDDKSSKNLDWVTFDYKPAHDEERHYLMGTKIANSAFENGDFAKKLSIRWLTDSSHDSIALDLPSNVPTPDILPMMGLGLLMWIGFRRKFKQSAKTVRF
jgi:hypothetical protein